MIMQLIWRKPIEIWRQEEQNSKKGHNLGKSIGVLFRLSADTNTYAISLLNFFFQYWKV